MTSQSILLVEDNPDDEALILRTLDKNHILNEVNVARDGAEQGGANSYVRKPVKFAKFADAVGALGVFWLLLNEPAPEFIPESD